MLLTMNDRPAWVSESVWLYLKAVDLRIWIWKRPWNLRGEEYRS